MINMLLNSLVNVLDINDVNDVMKTSDVSKNDERCFWRHKDISTERNIPIAYKEETLVSNYVLCHF